MSTKAELLLAEWSGMHYPQGGLRRDPLEGARGPPHF
jgi:hypothetical protein